MMEGKRVSFKWWNLSALEIFAGLHAKEKKSWNPHIDPQLNQLQLPQVYPVSGIRKCWLLTWTSSSSKTSNKPDYLVSSSWSHTAAQPCFSMINPWILPWRRRRARTEVCMHVCVCGTEQGQGRHHVFISVAGLHPTSAVQLPESQRGVLAGVERPLCCCVSLNRTWDRICERWSVSHAHITAQPGQFTRVLRKGLASASASEFARLQPIINEGAAARLTRVRLIR